MAPAPASNAVPAHKKARFYTGLFCERGKEKSVLWYERHLLTNSGATHISTFMKYAF